MKLVMRVGIAAAVLAAAVVIPAAPASAQVASRCGGPAEFTVCAMVEVSANGNWRAIGSLKDNTSGNDTVAVQAFAQFLPIGEPWHTMQPASVRVELNNYALTATPWFPCVKGILQAQINWNYKNGQRRGSMESPDIFETPCFP
jgi:hypothetical protein